MIFTLKLWRLLFISALALFFELLLIRYLSVEIRFFLFFKNFVLMASFLGLGLGTGFAGHSNAPLMKFFHPISALLVLIALFAPELNLNSVFLPTGDNSFLWYHSTSVGYWFDLLLLFTSFFGLTALVVLVFVPLGQLLGRALDELPPSRSYMWDLTGSIVGVIGCSLTAFLGLSPKFGIILVLLGALPFLTVRAQLIRSSMVTLGVLILLATVGTTPQIPQGAKPAPEAVASEYWWSPYHRVHWLPYPSQKVDAQDLFPGYLGFLNGYYYFDLLNFDLTQKPKAVRLHRQYGVHSFNVSSLHEAIEHYSLPYQTKEPPKSVLILGAGPGNDAAMALRKGAISVTAVEIDPAVIRLGKEIHPMKPYLDPRIRVVEDDARAFMARSNEQFDLVSFGHLDSINVISSFSSVRADSYVYTVESMQRAYELVRPGGTLSISFAGLDWINVKIAGLLQKATQQKPFQFIDGYLGTVTFLVKKPAVGVSSNQFEGAASPWEFDGDVLRSFSTANIDESTLPSDDWPFLFLRERVISPYHLLALVVLVASAAIAGRAIFIRTAVRQAFPWSSFWLGVGFMLIETKSITELGLLFGSTWIVAAVSIIGVLLMNLFAVAIVRQYSVPTAALYVALFGSIFANFLIPYEALLPFPLFWRIVLAIALVYSPLFFAGGVFAQIFMAASISSRVFGANLIGAMLGGALEYLSVLYGFKVLWIIAGFVYLLAFVSTRTSKVIPVLSQDERLRVAG